MEEPELHCLEALYCNDVGVNYTAFLADLEPQEPVAFMYVKRMEELRQTNCKQALPEQRPKKDLESVFLKIKTKVREIRGGERGRERDRQTDGERDRQTDRDRER